MEHFFNQKDIGWWGCSLGKDIATKPDDPRLSLRTYMVEREEIPSSCPLTTTCMYSQRRNEQIYTWKIFFKGCIHRVCSCVPGAALGTFRGNLAGKDTPSSSSHIPQRDSDPRALETEQMWPEFAWLHWVSPTAKGSKSSLKNVMKFE